MTLPVTPNPGTGNPNPLVTVEAYRRITGDQASTPDDITAWIADAVGMLCLKCNRTLEYGQYTEADYLYGIGMVYPSATPIDQTRPVISGADDNQTLYNPATDAGSSSVIQAAGIWVGFFTPLPWMPVWTGTIPPQTVITYSGGYQPYGATGDLITGATPNLPHELARAIAIIAYYSLHPQVVVTMGQSSQSMAGVSLGGDLSSFMQHDRNLRRIIRGFTRRQAQPWQN